MEFIDILKPKYKSVNKDIYETKVSPWDIFELDCFNRSLGLEVSDVIYILDKYSGKTKMSSTELELDLSTALYRKMGGTINTPLNNMLAFIYVLYRSPNFRLSLFVNMLNAAIQTDAIFHYLEEYKIITPSLFVDALFNSINNKPIIDIVNSRHNITIDTKVSLQDSIKFSEKLLEDVVTYYKGADTLLHVFKDLFNN